MREIRFRAFNTITGKMYQVRSLHNIHSNVNVHADLCNKPGETPATFSNSHWDTSEHDGYVYMQYTGLKDKTGKEIYEGDIVEWFSKFRDTDMVTPPKRGTVKYQPQGARFHIYYEDTFGKIYYREFSATFGNGEFQMDETLEVVGNTYENKDLLR